MPTWKCNVMSREHVNAMEARHVREDEKVTAMDENQENAGWPRIHADSLRFLQREGEEDSGLQCTKCGITRPCGFYNATSIRNRSRRKTLVCNVCQELQRCDRCMWWCASDGRSMDVPMQVRKAETGVSIAIFP